MTHARFRSPALLLAAAALTAAPALGQQQYDRRMQDREDDRFYQQDRMRTDRDQQVGGSWQYDQQQRRSAGYQQQGQRGMQDQQWRGQRQDMSGGEWVRIAVDLDNDGNFDSYHTVRRQDLRQLRLGSAGGPMRGGMQQQQQQTDRWQTRTQTQTPTRYEQDPFREWDDQQGWEQQRPDQFERRGWSEDRWDQRFDDDDDRYGRQSRWDQGTRQQQQTVRGEIESLNTVRFSGMRDEHVLARVTGEDGRIHNVDLGPQRSLRNLNLNEGDRITLTAMRGQINQRPVLLATSVEAGGRTVTVQRPLLGGGGGMEAGQMQRLSGEVLRTWESTFEHDDEDHLLALVRLNTGETKLVDLGPEDRLDDLDVGRNDRITIVGKAVTIDGMPALCARSIERGRDFLNIEPTGNVTNIRTEEGDTDRQMQRAGGRLD